MSRRLTEGPHPPDWCSTAFEDKTAPAGLSPIGARRLAMTLLQQAASTEAATAPTDNPGYGKEGFRALLETAEPWATEHFDQRSGVMSFTSEEVTITSVEGGDRTVQIVRFFCPRDFDEDWDHGSMSTNPGDVAVLSVDGDLLAVGEAEQYALEILRAATTIRACIPDHRLLATLSRLITRLVQENPDAGEVQIAELVKQQASAEEIGALVRGELVRELAAARSQQAVTL